MVKLCVFADKMVFLCFLKFSLFDGFYVKTDGAEAIVAANHGTMGIFHPAIVEVAFSSCKSFDKLFHGFPCFGA